MQFSLHFRHTCSKVCFRGLTSLTTSAWVWLAPYSDAPAPYVVVYLGSTSLTWQDQTADCVHYSCCSPTASASTAAAAWFRLLQLLFRGCTHFNCFSLLQLQCRCSSPQLRQQTVQSIVSTKVALTSLVPPNKHPTSISHTHTCTHAHTHIHTHTHTEKL